MRFSLQPFIASWLILALVLFGTTSPTTAGLVAFEDFSYGNGALAGQNGGFGWSGNWTHHNGTQPTVASEVANLQFSNSGFDTLHRSQISRELSSGFGGNGTTTWLRFNSSYFATGNSLNTVPFGGFRLLSNDSVRLQIGKYDDKIYWSVGNEDNTTIATSNVFVNTYTDFWVKITHVAGNDTVQMWLNPASNPTTEADLGSVAGTLTGLDISFDEIMLHGHYGNLGGDSTHTWTFDNIRIGTSFAAMTAVPEPSSLLMVGLIVAGLGAVRRRTV